MTAPPRRHAWRLVPAAGAGWAVAALTTLVPSWSAPVAGVLWAGAVGTTWWMLRRPRRALGVVAVSLAASGAIAAAVAFAQPARDAVAGTVAQGRSLAVSATVTGRTTPGTTGSAWFDATLHRLDAGGTSVRADVPIRVGIPVSAAGPEIGAAIGFDATGFVATPGDRAAVVLQAAEVEVRVPVAGPLALLAGMRTDLVAATRGLPGPGAALVPGLAVGDTSAVDAALDEAMVASSLSHLTAVSGANCAIVVGLAYGLAAWCGARRGVRVALGAAALVLFVALVTPEPSVVRAAAMAGVAMIALLLGRAGAALATLCLAIIVLLMIDPWLSLSIGFALSAASTAALILLARPLADGLGRVLPRPLALAIAVPLAAQLACAPLVVLLDPTVPVLGVLANLLAAPAAPLATVAGFLACLAAPVPVVQLGLVGIAWVPASWIAGVAQTTASVTALRLPWLSGPSGVVTLAVVGIAVVVAVVLPRSHEPRRRALRVGAVLVVAVVAGCAAATATLRSVAGPLTVPGPWSIVACDVGQGDALLLRSAERVALVDTGADATALRECLDRFGVGRLDLFVLTHFDVDHSGAVDVLVGRVDTVVHGPPQNADDTNALTELAAGGAEVRAGVEGMIGTLGAAEWTVVWPPSGAGSGGNDESVVLDVRGDGVPRTLLLGDLGAEAQARVRGRLTEGSYDVVKVSHHGSADQDPGLYDLLAARLALVSVGADNGYGHPTGSALDMLQADGSTTARTDRDGTIAVWTEGDELLWWRDGGVGAAG